MINKDINTLITISGRDNLINLYINSTIYNIQNKNIAQ